MAFDAVFLSAVRGELSDALIGARIDKVQQPDRQSLILHMRGRDGTKKLLISASPNTPRIHLTETSPEKPAQPPMFCMLLRKHLTGGRLAEIAQPPMERLLELKFDCTDEMGEPCRKSLIAELRGRGATLILCGADGRSIDCIRRVDFEKADSRQVLPGLFYRYPPLVPKKNPAETDENALLAMLQAVELPIRLCDWLLQTFGGLSPLVCRELSYLACGDIDADLSAMAQAQRKQCAARLAKEFSAIAKCDFQPVMLLEGEVPKLFSYRTITQYGDCYRQTVQPSFSALLDAFYAGRDALARMKTRTQTLQKTVTTLYERALRKLETQKKELLQAADRDHLRQSGDLIMAHLGQIAKGQTVLRAENFYDPDLKEVSIALSPTLSPQQNAAKYYKDYAKAKTAEKRLTEQIALGEHERDYLAGVLDELSRAESEKDVVEIRQELEDGGYLRKGDKKRMKLPPSRPMHFRSTEGFAIYVGRNNRQNDLLTCKTAAKSDLWLHAQKQPGSHVIIDCGGKTPNDQTITEAAMLAAWFSQVRSGQNVAIDCAFVKHVKKPAGAKPGMVVYDQYRTIFVTPDGKLPEALAVTL